MFRNLKIFTYKLIRDYHHRKVTYNDIMASRLKADGYSGYYYEEKAWKHLGKELKLNYILKGLEAL